MSKVSAPEKAAASKTKKSREKKAAAGQDAKIASKGLAENSAKPAEPDVRHTAKKPQKITPANLKKLALEYHSNPTPGKIAITVSKPLDNYSDFSLAYTPGVAAPCLEIEKNQENAYKYTNKGNLVGVITNGTAVLGLGDIGALASKPVMEGKAMLFKRFAGIDVFDIELKAQRPEKFIETVLSIADTFGAINIEDVAAPACFPIEERLREQLSIPVMHDDQTGTAVVVCAALHNALEIQNKRTCDIRIVCIGAGAAGVGVLRVARQFFGFGSEQLQLVDRHGLITYDRINLPSYKLAFASKADSGSTAADVIRGADVLIGVSGKGSITPAMVKSMGVRPIIMALANPDPEIMPDEVHAVRDDAIVATGRSDFANQVNNSVGFPYLFRGALDAHAKKFTPAMTSAAIRAIAGMARQPVYPELRQIYNNEDLIFGPGYILPKQSDKRLLETVSPAVQAAYREEDLT